MNIINEIESSNPAHSVTEKETDETFVKFCAYMCILHNKKLNLATILLKVLSEPEFTELMLKLMDIDDKRECIRIFFRRDVTLHKSKYIKNYVDSL